jgi:riboflavin synthase
MFTGIIQDVGRVKSLKRLGDTARLEALAPGLSVELRPGDSVAVNGVCLTVTDQGGQGFQADLSRETLERSNLGSLRAGDSINLELPLLPTARLGGHFVQGHVDAVSRVVTIDKQRAFALFRFSLPPGMRAYVVEKGSIAVDGISLTVSGLGKDFFEVAIIPHTLEHTNLARRSRGDRVNLECDILAKYVEAALSHRRPNGSRGPLTAQYLRDQGYG